MLMRLLAMTGLVTVPFLLLAFGSGQAEGAIWLMFPVVYMIPIAFVCLVLFQPSENLARRFGISPNIIVPIVGSLVGIVVVYAASRVRTSRFWEKAQAGDLETIGAALGVVLVGALIGVAWRVSLKIVHYFGWSQ